MSIHVLSATKYIAECSGWSMSHLRIQKIIYLTHMFHLGRENGTPLIDGFFEAWDYGPVHPTLYHEAKIFGADAVRNIFRSQPVLGKCREKEYLDVLYSKLKDFSGGQLVTITHHEEGAWSKNYIPGARGVIIPNEDIVAEYNARWKPSQ